MFNESQYTSTAAEPFAKVHSRCWWPRTVNARHAKFRVCLHVSGTQI